MVSSTVFRSTWKPRKRDQCQGGTSSTEYNNLLPVVVSWAWLSSEPLSRSNSWHTTRKSIMTLSLVNELLWMRIYLLCWVESFVRPFVRFTRNFSHRSSTESLGWLPCDWTTSRLYENCRSFNWWTFSSSIQRLLSE